MFAKVEKSGSTISYALLYFAVISQRNEKQKQNKQNVSRANTNDELKKIQTKEKRKIPNKVKQRQKEESVAILLQIIKKYFRIM